MSLRIEGTDGKARTGTLVLPSGRQIETPTMLLYTRRGGAPNLTVDLVESLQPRAQALQLNALQFLGNSVSVLQNFPGSSRDFLSIDPQTAIVVTPRDPTVYEYQGAQRQSTDDWAAITTSGGAVTVTPEAYMATVAALQPDLAILLSDDIPADAKRDRAVISVDRSLSWLRRCLNSATTKATWTAFAAIQGGPFPDQRRRHADLLLPLMPSLAGVCVAGLGTGESHELRDMLIKESICRTPPDKARMLSGVGTPGEVVDAIVHGIDLFDMGFLFDVTNEGYALCFPIDILDQEDEPLLGKHGMPDADEVALTGRDDTKLNLWSTAYETDVRPLVQGCTCLTCKSHTRAYIHHLLQAHEMSSQVLLEAHNTTHYLRFFEAIRQVIKNGKIQAYRDALLAWKQRWIVMQAASTEELPDDK